MFYVELTRARDNVVPLTDDREALIEALENSPAEQMSALKAIGEQCETSVSASAPTVPRYPPPEKAAVLDETIRERRREANGFVDRTLAAASLRERDERAREAHSHDAHPEVGLWGLPSEVSAENMHFMLLIHAISA